MVGSFRMSWAVWGFRAGGRGSRRVRRGVAPACRWPPAARRVAAPHAGVGRSEQPVGGQLGADLKLLLSHSHQASSSSGTSRSGSRLVTANASTASSVSASCMCVEAAVTGLSMSCAPFWGWFGWMAMSPPAHGRRACSRAASARPAASAGSAATARVGHGRSRAPGSDAAAADRIASGAARCRPSEGVRLRYRAGMRRSCERRVALRRGARIVGCDASRKELECPRSANGHIRAGRSSDPGCRGSVSRNRSPRCGRVSGEPPSIAPRAYGTARSSTGCGVCLGGELLT